MAEPKVTRIPGKLESMLRKFSDLFTKPSYVNFAYMVAAVTACLLPKNIQNLHKIITNTCKNKKDYQTYRYFFGKAKWDGNEVAQKKADLFFKAVGAKKGKRILIIVDDTFKEKKGEKTFGVGWFWDHSVGKNIWANNIVTSIIQCKNQFIFHKARIYVKEEDAEKWRVAFKKKPEIAYEEMIKPLDIPKGANVYVVCDAAYFNKGFINNCRSGPDSYQVIGRVKYDLLIVQDDDSNINVKDYFEEEFKKGNYKKITITVRGKKKTYWIVESIVNLKSIGKCKIVASKKSLDDGDDAKYYGSTDTCLSGRVILSIYEKRWNIETAHREGNQKLGFKEYQVRSKESIERFFQTIFVVWTVLLLIELDKEGALEGMKLLSKMLDSTNTLHFIELFYTICGYLGTIPPPLGGLTQCLQEMGYAT